MQLHRALKAHLITFVHQTTRSGIGLIAVESECNETCNQADAPGTLPTATKRQYLLRQTIVLVT